MDARSEWPMDSYISSWRLFRRLADENQITAEHVVSRHGWPHHTRNLRIVDFGCGDGTLIESIVLASTHPVATVHLIDPDQELLHQAKERIEGINVVRDVQGTQGRAEEVIQEATREADVALAVHLVYLLKEDELKKLLAGLTPGVPLFIIMDQNTSVFTTLWKKTAPKYHARLVHAHHIIEKLGRDGYSVEKTEFDSHLTSPLMLREDLQHSILSLFCYRNFKDLDAQTQEWVKDIIVDHSASGRVVCDCVCYEVERRS